MKRCVWAVLTLVLLAGCAHLEVPRQDIYPFRAEFTARGNVRGTDLDVQGAILLTSPESGIIQTYGPGGVATGTIDITPGGFVLRDMWGRVTDTRDLPLRGIVGLIAGDVPRGSYLYRVRTGDGMRVVYPWGSLHVDEAVLPRELHIEGERALDVGFTASGGTVNLEVRHGADTMWSSLLVRQGGRWISP